MSKAMQTSAVAAAGLATTILTVAANALLHWLIGFNLFGFSIFFIVPAGAIACGFAAASGYFYAAKFFHIRPTKLLLLQMVVVAAFAQFLIYYAEYQMLYIEGQHIADVVSFGKYLDVVLTTQHVKFGRAAQIDGGAVGDAGYWLAVLDFIGFLIGGVAVYFFLLAEPACEPCGKYLKTLVKKQDSFDDEGTFGYHYDNEFAHPVDSPEFAEHVGTEYTAPKVEKGNINLETKVLECPECGDQTVAEKVSVYNGRDWKDVDELKRAVAIPKGLDVRRAYAGLGK